MRLHLPKGLLAALLAACFALPAGATQYRWGDADPGTSTGAGPEKSTDGATWNRITYDTSHTLTNTDGSITFTDAGDYLITGIPEGGWNSGTSVVAPTVDGVEQKVASAWFSATGNKRIYMTGENISKMSNIFLTGVHFVVGTDGTSSTTHTIASNLFLGAGVWAHTQDVDSVHHKAVLRANADTNIKGDVTLTDSSAHISTWSGKDITFAGSLNGNGKSLSVGAEAVGSVINLNGSTNLGSLTVGAKVDTSGSLPAKGAAISVVIGASASAEIGNLTLLNGSTLTNKGKLSIGGTYTGNTIHQSSSSSLILKDGAVVNLDGLEQQTICSATETGFQSYHTQYVLSTHGIGSIEEDATVQFKLNNQEAAGTFNEGVYTPDGGVAGTCYHIASDDTVSYNSLATVDTGDFINVVGKLTADDVITKSVNLAGGTLVGKGNNVTGTLSITKDSTLELNGNMSLTGAISSVSGHALIVSLDQNVTSGVLTISGSAALNTGGEVSNDAQVGKLDYGTLQIEDGVTVNVSGRKGGNAQIAGDIVVKGGGTLNLTSADTLGYDGGNFTDSITLQGTADKTATLNLADTQTLTTSLILKGNTSITGEAMNSFGGSITVTGTSNIIGNEVQARKLLSINVVNADDCLQMADITKSTDGTRDCSFTKQGAGLLTITGNVGAADTGKDIKNVTVEAGKMEVQGAFYGKLTQQGGETVLGGRSTITTMDCTGGSVEMKGADSSITTLTGSGSLKVSGNTGVTDASRFSGSLESGAVLSISEGVKGLKSLKINTGGEVWAFTGTETNSISSIKIDEVVLAGGTAGIYVKGPSTNTAVQTDTLIVSAASTLSADLTLLDNAGLVVNVGGVTAETATAICSLNGALTLGSELSLTLSNLGKFKAGESIKLFSDVTSVTYTIPTTGVETDIAALSEDVATTGTLDADGIDASQVFSNVDAGTYTLKFENNIVALVAQRDVPEPTTATLSLLALMGLAARRRRKA